MASVISIADKRDPEWRIRQLLAENLGYDAEELDPGFRLRADLHMDGDDAMRFFTKFGKEFSVDLTEMRSCWLLYFNPEKRWLSKATKLSTMVAVSAGLLEWILFPHFSAIAGFVTVLGIFIVVRLSIEIAQRLNDIEQKPGQQEITIADLIAAASADKWQVPEEMKAWALKQQSLRRLI